MHFVFLDWPLTEEQLQEAVTASGVLNVPTDFLNPEIGAESEMCIPHPGKIESSECKEPKKEPMFKFKYTIITYMLIFGIYTRCQ